MSTFEKVREIIARQLKRPPEEFNEDTNLYGAGFESLDVIEAVFAIEEEFDLDINFNANTAGDGDGFQTLGQIVKLVEAELAKKNAK